MCTMTWFTNEGGYELFFNRDESLSRCRAELPTVQDRNGVSYISPTDVDAGGSWIAVNEFGITVCLLNHYEFEQIETYKNWVSRGEVVREFSNTIDLELAEQQFNGMLLEDYRAFRMFMIDRAGNNILCVWDGHTARLQRNVKRPKSSSSVNAKHVKTLRRDLFENLNLAESQVSQDYLNFHASHLPGKSQESVCMHRDDAKTVSLSHVTVTSAGVTFAYADGSPCEAVLGSKVLLPLADAALMQEMLTVKLAVVNQ